MSNPEATGGDPALPKKEREAEEVWEEIAREIDTQCPAGGIPANLKEWSGPVPKLGNRWKINVKPMVLGPDGEATLIESNLYRERDHVEIAIAVAGWKNNDRFVLIAVTSPVGPFTPLHLNPLEFGKHALEVVQHKQIRIPFLPASSPDKPN